MDNRPEKFLKCSKCGSGNIEITRSIPPENEGFFQKLLRKTRDRTMPSAPLSGKFYVICRDCGNVTMILK